MIIISISGKSDFQDMCSMHYSPEEIIKKYRIYVGEHDIIPLKFEEPKDLIPYYPYLVGSMFSDKNGGVIYLSNESFIDREEREHLEWHLRDLLVYYRKCKRKKQPFDKEEALKKISYFGVSPEDIELVDRVEKLGEKATVEDIHDRMHDRMRQQLYDLMVENGWDENVAYRWIFGWKRYWDKIKEEKEHESE